ncbi:MAG: nuclear transport factor 2 family protein [bacterium]|nr:nuclear transport factor 2 family protein [bacterium]
MKKLFVGLAAFVFLISVSEGEKKIEKDMLLQKDGEIAKTAAKKGILQAFYPYMTAQTILLPQNGHPVHGKDACAKLIKKKVNQEERKFKWEPLLANVSAAGDLAYTHGRFKRPSAEDKINYGYYGTIWQKDAAGNWKVVVSQGLLRLKKPDQKPAPNQIHQTRLDAVTKEVVDTEYAFSNYSVKNGTPQAFYRFIADNGIALSPAGPPRTKDDYAKAAAAKEKKNPKTTLQWKPFFSHAAASADMAYNYGPYKYSITTADGNTKNSYGYFVTVWKKQPNNSWKFLFDGGNQYASGGSEPF